MANRYRQAVNSSKTRFTAAPMGELEFSRMYSNPTVITDFNAGEIVPVGCYEVLPHDTFDFSVAFDIRQSTIVVPTMGKMMVDFYAFFVPNRLVNESWKNVMGENTSGSWIADEVSLSPLVSGDESSIAEYSTPEGTVRGIKVPVGSIADYYGFPTQGPISVEVLQQCHDLKFCGYYLCYNHYFRDQNYQAPIPVSKLNVYKGFFTTPDENRYYSFDGRFMDHVDITGAFPSNGRYPDGAIVKALYGEGGVPAQGITISGFYPISVLGKPLKANKLHDYFTSVLPTPQKGRRVVIDLGESAPLDALDNTYAFDSGNLFSFHLTSDLGTVGHTYGKVGFQSSLQRPNSAEVTVGVGTDEELSDGGGVNGTNLVADLSGVTIGLDDLRMSAAVQQFYEILGRSGSRYIEFVNSFFGLEVDNPFDDMPTFLGRVRRELDLYQTAQTSASSADGSSSPQGNLAAFGYTSNGGHLFNKTFVEHGYVHIFAVVRHRNLYSSYLARDNFRRSMLDFYSYPLANITEQPVYTREINPFLLGEDSDAVFGYNEAWAEYRFDPDSVTGHMRSGLGSDGLDFWNYADELDNTLYVADGEWIKSNSAEVLARTTALSEELAPQFKAQITYSITKQRPMPTYSVPGLDII